MSNTGNKRRPRKKPQRKINYNMKRKLVMLFSAVLLALVALTARITYINATRHSRNIRARPFLPSVGTYMTGMEISWQPATRFIM